MAEITLADYTGYIFREIIRAREMADQHSRQLAEVYAKDPVMKHFSVPRFKVPKMELTIPVLISGARFNKVLRFDVPRDQFREYLVSLARHVVSVVKGKDGTAAEPEPPQPPQPRRTKARPGGRATARAIADIEGDLSNYALGLWDALDLKSNREAADVVRDELVRNYWHYMFRIALESESLSAVYRKRFPNNELLKQTTDTLTRYVTSRTVVESTSIQSLLINPETNVVKNGSSDTSVFTLKAEMLEEGFFIREITDESGQTRPVVEFE